MARSASFRRYCLRYHLKSYLKNRSKLEVQTVLCLVLMEWRRVQCQGWVG